MVFLTKYLQKIKKILSSTPRKLLCSNTFTTSKKNEKRNQHHSNNKIRSKDKMGDKVADNRLKGESQSMSQAQYRRSTATNDSSEVVSRCSINVATKTPSNQQITTTIETECNLVPPAPHQEVAQSSFRLSSAPFAIDSQILPPYIFNKADTLSAEHIHLSPMYEHPNHHDKRKIFSALKRHLQPYKTFYEIEWTFPNYANATTSKVWLQIDRQTSSGIERVRRLGFSSLDVRLDGKLTRYINKSVLIDKKIENVLVEIVFSHRKPDTRKDSVLQSDTSSHIVTRRQDLHFVRLRRVHWWTVDYHFAKTICLSS